MHLHRSETSGLYKPTFFSLFLNAPNVLTEQKRIDGAHGIVFFHEYIHFLQDLLTNFGLRNIIDLILEYSVINNEILNSPAPSFTIPFDSTNPQLQINAQMRILTLGTESIGYEDEDFGIVTMERQAYSPDPGLPFSYVSVRIRYHCDGELDEFYLGALHFLENMAHLLERSFSFEDNAPPYPYKVIEKIVRWYFPDGDLSAETLVTVMEDALQTMDPAGYLYDLVNAFSVNGSPFTRATVDDFAAKYKLRLGTHLIHPDKLFFENAASARRGFRILFAHGQLAVVKEWSDYVLSNVIKIKRAGFSFRELLSKGFEQQRVLDRTAALVQKLGTPLMMDKGHALFYSAPKPQFAEGMQYLVGLEAIISILRHQLPCSVLPICSHLPDGTDMSNGDCHEAPWNRAQQLPRCVVGQLWIMWGFVQKQVVIAGP